MTTLIEEDNLVLQNKIMSFMSILNQLSEKLRSIVNSGVGLDSEAKKKLENSQKVLESYVKLLGIFETKIKSPQKILTIESELEELKQILRDIQEIEAHTENVRVEVLQLASLAEHVEILVGTLRGYIKSYA